VIELVVPESPMTQGSPAEEQQQPENHDIEDKADEEQLPQATRRMRRCTEIRTKWSPSGLKLWSPPAGFGLCWNTWASTLPPSTGSRKSRVQGGWSSRPSQRSSSALESSVGTRGQLLEHLTATLWLTPPSKPSLRGPIATRVGWRTPSTASYHTGRRINSRPMG
jgi:hypothetical protein